MKPLSQEDLRHIFATALHSGIGYWAGQCIELKIAQDGNPVYARFPDMYTKEILVADLSTIHNGVDKLVTQILTGHLNGHYLNNLKGHGIRAIAPSGADLVVQLGLFESVRYLS